jgi:hypothetical protein
MTLGTCKPAIRPERHEYLEVDAAPRVDQNKNPDTLTLLPFDESHSRGNYGSALLSREPGLLKWHGTDLVDC